MQRRVRYSILVSVIALVVALSSDAVLADSLSGKVMDPQGLAIAKARVRLFDKNGGGVRTVVSSADGSYSFPGVSEGEYLVEAEAADSALKISQEISVKGDRKSDLKLEISSRSAEVLVTASAQAQSIEEVAKAVDVVSAEQIELRDELSISEAIRNLPGMQIKNQDWAGGISNIQTRGLRAQDTAILFDGMRFRDASGIQGDATAFLEELATVDTDRIEFLRGSGSSLYGSHALGGVINITSKMGGGKPHGQLLVEGGGLGLFRTLYSVGGGVSEDRVTYSNTITQLKLFNGVRDGSPFRNFSNQGAVRFNITPRMSVTGRGWYSNHDLTSTENPTFTNAILANSASTGPVKAVPLSIENLKLFEQGQAFDATGATYIPNQIDPDGHREGSFFSGGVTFQHQVSSNTSYRVVWQGLKTARRYVDGPLGPGSFEPTTETTGNFNGYTGTLKAQVDQRVGNYNQVTFGYEFEQERFSSFDGATYNSPTANAVELKQRSNAFYIQDQISLVDGQLHFTIAGRAQSFNLLTPVFTGLTTPYAGVSVLEPPTAYTGDGAFAYLVKQSGTKIRGHVGNSFRAPSEYERFGGGFGSYFGDPTLAPERAVAVDGGIDQYLMGSKIQASATVFYTNLQQVILFANSLPAGDAFGRFFGYANGGGGIARGAELSGKYSPTQRTTFEGSYTYTNSDQNTPTIQPNYYKVLGLSPHTATFAVTHRQGPWSIAYDMIARSDYTMTLSGGGSRQFVFNGPTTADVVVSYTIPTMTSTKVDVFGKVNNLTGQRAHMGGFVGPGAWFIGGMRWKY